MFGAFAAVTGPRWWLTDRLIRRGTPLDEPKRQFWGEFGGYVAAGLLAAAFNHVVLAFPVFSGFKLFVGVVVVGFFLSLDLALAREASLIRAPVDVCWEMPSGRYIPMSRTLVWFALTCAVSASMVLGLILSRDLAWLSAVGRTPSDLAVAVRAVALEIIFVMASLTALVLNVIVAYSRNLKKLFAIQMDAMKRVSEGDLQHEVPVTRTDEFGVIASFTNDMIEGLRQRTRLMGAMDVAEEVQRTLLPKTPPIVPGLDIAASSLYSEQTGGDFYDFIMLPGGRLLAVVGDVSGHGVGAALLMTSARAFIRMAAGQNGSLPDMMSRVNTILYRDVAPTGRFATVFSLEIDPATKRMRWVRGGHEPGWLYDPLTKDFLELGGAGLALGLQQNLEYGQSERVGWNPGALVVLGTDGIWETTDRRRRMYGKDRLKDVLRGCASASSQEILDAVLASLNRFRDGAELEDDVTLVVIKLA